MTKIVSAQPRIVQVRSDDLDLARRRHPQADADTHDGLAVVFAALRDINVKSRNGFEAAKMIAEMLPTAMQKKLGRQLVKAS